MKFWFVPVSLSLTFCLTPCAHSVVSCFHKDIADFGRELKKPVVVFKNALTQRKTVEEYAEAHNVPDIANKVAATAKLKCPTGISTANLIVKGNIILGAGHPFIDRKTCKQRSDPAKCMFLIEGRPPMKVKKLRANGIACPDKLGLGTDWAILELEQNVNGIKPYKVKAWSSRNGVHPQDVVAVGAESADFRRIDPKTKKVFYPKHVQNCSIKRVYYITSPKSVGSNCAGSSGKSGGAFLDPDLTEPTIMGITTSSPLSDEEAAREARTGVPIEKDFDDMTSADKGVAISDELYDKIQEVTQ